MNFIFISPNFPDCYYKFCVALKNRGILVLGIGEASFNELREELKSSLTEYQYCNLHNYNDVEKIVAYYEAKYGSIDYLESNNEYWLTLDATLRTRFNITSGVQLDEVPYIRYKNKMKEIFKTIDVIFPRFIVASTIEELITFKDQVGYPIFGKPLDGIGGFGTYTIKCDEDLLRFTKEMTNLSSYIIEEFIEGHIESFDGICDDNSNVVICDSEIFPISDALIDEEDLDSYYYCVAELSSELIKLGKAVVKAFGIKKRNFHIEFFKLSTDKPGLGKKGSFVIDEVNMRSPGGNSTDLIQGALGFSPYEVYADIIAYGTNNQPTNAPKKISISINRKNKFSYVLSLNEILAEYKDNIYQTGTYPPAFSRNMGDYYFLATFNTLDEALQFKQRTLEKIVPPNEKLT
jgi:hypothetical protein